MWPEHPYSYNISNPFVLFLAEEILPSKGLEKKKKKERRIRFTGVFSYNCWLSIALIDTKMLQAKFTVWLL